MQYDHFHYPLYSPEQLDKALQEMNDATQRYGSADDNNDANAAVNALDDLDKSRALYYTMLEANYRAVNGGVIESIAKEYQQKVHEIIFGKFRVQGRKSTRKTL